MRELVVGRSRRMRDAVVARDGSTRMPPHETKGTEQ